MAIKTYAVRIGNRYGIQYEEALKEKLDIEFLHEEKEEFKLQWNKLHFFNLDIDEAICVIDIDIKLINDYQKLFEYPIDRGEFLTIKPWWNKRPINGGFYKFYPSDTKFIYEEFKKNRKYWEKYFIENGRKPGPVNGEEDFVHHIAKDKLNLKYIPDTWVTKMEVNQSKEFLVDLNKKYPGDYAFLGNKYNRDIKLIHYYGLGQLFYS